jgi:2-succinyl-6-hydroxy-2,4-cyclohexadiene-1-carboxylate synthase
MSATSEAATTDRLVFLHGFTQTHHHWHRCAHLVADRLPTSPTLAFVDLPGHGLSGDDRLGIDASGPSLIELAGAATYIGYSMGGRFALTAASAGTGVVERLVLIGATPGLREPAERSERRRLDSERAERLEQIGIDAFLDEWLAAPLFDTLPADERGLEQRRRNGVAGLAHSLRRCGTGNQAPLWDHLDELSMPVLVIAGTRDPKFTEIGRQMTEALPNGVFAPIASAGHAAHLEQPEATADVIAGWLADTALPAEVA